GWTWSNVGAGTYTVTARATDNLGATTTSSPVTVIVTTPGGSAWLHQDVGTVGVTGSASNTGSTFSIDASGTDIWGTADGFQVVYQTLTGDGEIRARVTALENTDPWAKAGVMIRASLAASAPHAFMLLSAGNGTGFERRVSAGGATVHTASAGSAPIW